MVTLAGSSVLVVGAGGGLGAPISAALAAAGARLTLAGRTEGPLRALGVDGAVVVTGDLTDPAWPAALVTAAVEVHGRLDGVVLVAGVVAFAPAAEVDDAVLEQLVATNFLGPVRLLRAAVPRLRSAAAERGEPSFVVHVTGVVAEQPAGGMAAYSASKAALAAYDAAAARELRRSGVLLLDARPPHTETGLAGRPIAGTAPKMPRGLSPEQVASRIVAALEDDERDLPSAAFTG